jgi:hypothetical protein
MNRTKLPILAVILMSLLSVGTLLFAAGIPSPQTTEAQLVQAVREQVELLKVVGGAMVSGLAGAVVWLWTTLNKEQTESKRINEKSADADDRLAQSIEKLTDRLEVRPCLLKKEPE